MGICNGNWYLDLVYSGSKFAQSQPKQIAICEILDKYNQTIAGTPSPTSAIDIVIAQQATAEQYGIELAIMVPITMIIGLIFLIIVLYRSCNKQKLDWYRLIAIYIAVTLGVPLSIALGPQDGGFNRVIGFGILIHNLGELFIINHVYFGNPGNNGKNRFSAIYAIFYIWIIMALITFLEPLWLLYLILMIQGSWCDWTLVGTFIYLGTHFNVKQKCDCCCGKKLDFGTFGIFAALTHILSIQPLFFYMAIPTFQAGAPITVILLMPTFILYILFSSSNPATVPKIIESQGYAYLNLTLNEERNDLLRDMAGSNGNGKQYELKQRNVTGAADEEQKSDEAPKEKDEATIQTSMEEEMDSKGSIYDFVINNGLYYMDSGAHYKPMIKIVIFASITCLANCLLILFAPCYITPRDCGYNTNS